MTKLDERKRRILAAIVREYIATVEPVGSKRLLERHDWPISPATVRNEMASLEDEGFLRQPHPSAGRVPSDRGYRLFVDELMDRLPAPRAWRNQVAETYGESVSEIDELLRQTCQLLSRITFYTSLALAPSPRKTRLLHLELSRVGPNRILILLLTDAGHVVHRPLETAQRYAVRDVEAVGRFLRRKLLGLPLSEIEALDLGGLRREVGVRGSLLDEVVREVREYLAGQEDWHIHLDGTTYILREPEFSDIERLTRAMEAIDRADVLADLLQRGARGPSRVSYSIGHENRFEEAVDLGLVMASYRTPSEARGAIGVVGPTRMRYEEVSPSVEYAAGLLERALMPAQEALS